MHASNSYISKFLTGKKETKTEAQPEAKTETKTAARTEAQPETKTETKTEAKKETKQETKQEKKQEMKKAAKKEANKKHPSLFANTTTVKMDVQIPEIAVTSLVYQKIKNFTHIAPGEFSLLGLIKEQKNDDGRVLRLLIDEVFFVEQLNSSASSDIEPEAQNKLAFELIARKNGDVSRMKAWIHSHGSMDAFWSSTDLTQMSNLRKHSDYFISIVVNKANKWRVRLDVVSHDHPIITPVEAAFDKLDYTVIYEDHDCFEECLKEYEDKSQEEVIVSNYGRHTYSHYKGGRQRHRNQDYYNRWEQQDVWTGWESNGASASCGFGYGAVDIGDDDDYDVDANAAAEALHAEEGGEEEEAYKDEGDEVYYYGEAYNFDFSLIPVNHELSRGRQEFTPEKIRETNLGVYEGDLWLLWVALQTAEIDENEYWEKVWQLKHNPTLSIHELLSSSILLSVADFEPLCEEEQ